MGRKVVVVVAVPPEGFALALPHMAHVCAPGVYTIARASFVVSLW